MALFSLFPVLYPHGSVALAERGLMLQASEYMLIVAVPVLLLTVFFAWRYRAGNSKATYAPQWEHSKLQELLWWAIPLEVVLVLGALTWSSTHILDPRAALTSEPPLVVQVVALDWKWLFIYPTEGVASVNYARIPVGKPVRFEVTADAPMNSFWVPALGGQIYAMTGMVNALNLMATKEGTFAGASANYSGAGFAQMKFLLQALPQEQFDSWVAYVSAASGTSLTQESYEALAHPSIEGAILYALTDQTLFDHVVDKYLDPTAPAHTH